MRLLNSLIKKSKTRYITNRRINIGLISLLFIIATLTACRTNRVVVKPIKDKSPAFLTKKLDNNLLEYDYISFKSEFDVRLKNEKKSFKANIRMKRDSIIWISISPLLGIEVARIMFTQDSIKLIDKWNDQFYLGDFEYINNKFDTELNFNMVQDLFVGNPIYYDNNEKFISAKDENHHILTSKNKKNLRKALGLDKLKKEDSPTKVDSLEYDINQKRLRKAIKKNEEEELIVKRYWIDPEVYKIEKSLIHDLSYNRIFEVEYTDFEEVKAMLFPSKTKVLLKESEKYTNISIGNSRIRINKPLNFPFNIPDKFERIQ